MKFKHVEKLIRGKKSGANVGSRDVGHRLTQDERATFERSLKSKFLILDILNRSNLRNVWEKTCVAKNWPCIVLTKDLQQGVATVEKDRSLVFSGELKNAKAVVKKLIDK
jgi:hypothetical protein